MQIVSYPIVKEITREEAIRIDPKAVQIYEGELPDIMEMMRRMFEPPYKFKVLIEVVPKVPMSIYQRCVNPDYETVTKYYEIVDWTKPKMIWIAYTAQDVKTIQAFLNKYPQYDKEIKMKDSYKRYEIRTENIIK